MMLQSFIGNPDHIQGIHVDHINHNPLDNRKENLRITKVEENTKNRKARNTNNTTGYRNVSYITSNKSTPYFVQLVINGRNTVLGKFYDVDDAGEFAEKMRNKYYGEYAGLS